MSYNGGGRDPKAFDGPSPNTRSTFTDDASGKLATLKRVKAEMINLHNGNKIEAERAMAACLANDRRFDAYDKQRLIEKASHALDFGSVLDWDDPFLRRGGTGRPASLKGWSRTV